MNLRQTLYFVHQLLDKAKIEHALIGGLGMACYGSTRATIDLDLLVKEKDKKIIKELFHKNGFNLDYESVEVMQFSGLGLVDLLIARRPIAEMILQNAKKNGPEGIHFAQAEDLIGLKIQAYKNDPNREFQDKADIQFLIQSQKNLDWNLIKKYADLFNEWQVINDIKEKYQP